MSGGRGPYVVRGTPPRGCPPVYLRPSWRGGWSWTSDPAAAHEFARKADAVYCARHADIGRGWWVESRAVRPAAVPSVRPRVRVRRAAYRHDHRVWVSVRGERGGWVSVLPAGVTPAEYVARVAAARGCGLDDVGVVRF